MFAFPDYYRKLVWWPYIFWKFQISRSVSFCTQISRSLFGSQQQMRWLFLFYLQIDRFFRILTFFLINLKIRFDIELIFLVVLLDFFVFVFRAFLSHKYFNRRRLNTLFYLLVRFYFVYLHLTILHASMRVYFKSRQLKTIIQRVKTIMMSQLYPFVLWF